MNGSHVAARSVEIGGAGPAGLAAAITLARAGRHVIVHEVHPCVGFRFRRDLQGLENWTTDEDALAWLRGLGITTTFAATPCHGGFAFDHRRRAYEVRSDAPFFYMVERGPGAHSLDAALLDQARALGVEVRFGSRLDRFDRTSVLALGPRAAGAIAVGYHFDTRMADGFWVICDDDLAPKGYAYLLVTNGRGTVKSCMFADFERDALYVERTVAAFRRLAGLTMIDPRPHGGIGSLGIPDETPSGSHRLAGEHAGFQDALWGFGMRLAIASGVLAARSVLEGVEYDVLWRRAFLPQLQAALVNRAVYETFGNRGYAWLLRAQQRANDPRRFLRGLYRRGLFTRLMLPWARRRFGSRPRGQAESGHAASGSESEVG